MGYSIAVKPRTPKLRQKMVDFMRVNYVEPDKFFVNKKTGKPYMEFAVSDLCLDRGMSYVRDKGSLGFDYGAIDDIERFYIHSVCQWMAVKIGKKRFFSLPKYSHDVPRHQAVVGDFFWLNYDGVEKTPLVNVDEYGFKMWYLLNKKYPYIPDYIGDFCFMILNKRSPKAVNDMVHEEIKRLDKLWNEA